jgi:hypothetical protein
LADAGKIVTAKMKIATKIRFIVSYRLANFCRRTRAARLLEVADFVR